MSIKIALIRHLKPTNTEIFLGSREDVDITNEDSWKIQEISKFLNKINLKVKVVESSPLKRCIKTAEQLSKELGLETKIEIRETFKEIDFGDFGGLTKEEIIKKFPKLWEERKKNKWYFKHPNGESYAEVLERVWPDISNSENNRVIVTHANIIYVILAKILGLEDRFRMFTHNLKIGYGSLVVIEKENDELKILEIINWE